MTDLIVERNGNIRMIYDESIDFHSLGEASITRASHVEPISGGTWIADLTPIGGPVLGPMESRSIALALEIQWIKSHWLLACR